MQVLIALIAGLIFGFGLVVSGMSNPSKVLNFLDIFGSFDASLLFVMAGAVLTSFVGYRLVLRRPHPLFATEFPPSPSGLIDWRFILGALMFGVGWGLVGFCPGPALASLTFGGLSALVFVGAMLIGLMIEKMVSRIL